MKHHGQSLGSRIVIITLIWLLGTPLVLVQAAPATRLGQQDQPQQAQTGQTQGPVMPSVSPVLDQRVGIDPNQILRLSLHDAILKALGSNNTIQMERANILASEQGLRAAQGAYDIGLQASISAETPERPSNSVEATDYDFDGTPLFRDDNGDGIADNTRLRTTRQRSVAFNFTAQQLMPTGATWRFQIDTNRFSTDTQVLNVGGFVLSGSSFAVLPSYTTNVTLQFTQPLLKNFRMDQPRRQIRIAKKALELSDSQFRQRVIDIITQVQQAYWDLVFSIRSVEIQREALELAKTNLDNNRKQVEAGTLAPIELAQSRAQVEQSQQALTAAIGTVTARENTVKGLIFGDPYAPEWNTNIHPTESIEHLPSGVDFESAMRLAQANRPELEQLRFRREQNDIDIKYYGNQAKPQVDLFARYVMTGLAGKRVPFEDPTTGLIVQAPNAHQGGPFQSLGNAFSNDYPTYSFGLSFSFPIRNRTALGLLGQAKAQSRSLEYQEQQLLQVIGVEVRNALQFVESARQNIDATRAARVARQTQLEGEQKKFEAGLSTTFFVLQFQNFLSEARLAELNSLVNYNKAIADLQRVMSTTLSVNNVEISPHFDDK